MQELGNIQNVGQGAYWNRATPRRTAQHKEAVAGRQSMHYTAPEEAMNSIEAILALVAESAEKTAGGIIANEQTTTSSARKTDTIFGRIDRNFGVEPLSYKNMWKVLKTVVKEIGEIKEASSGRFFLGVSERLDKATTLMQFGSIVDYLEEGNVFSQGKVPPEAAGGAAGQIAANPTMSLQVQANIVPDMALRLLGGTRLGASVPW